MASNSSTSIARKARTRAEADFATWLMMAKLGSFDDLPENAQTVLSAYRGRLDQMSETDSKAIAVREIYQTYYSEMGGAGDAPEPEPRKPSSPDNVVRFQKPPEKPKPKPMPRPAALRGARPPDSGGRRPVPALLIFAAMVAAIAAYKFMMQ
ncbi:MULTISPECIES: hypothetical protein [Rhodopseudomonas]|uniref:Uncharacterized protein n=1 Tax=Rhodopseudomonas palustris TaxID=1076 RepID=A0A0D7ESC0_RHOPL|nr:MULTISPECIES: hypothetical protein [Rhodopseudomonas]KIZ42327.1 hypothetical protein OO17_13120 [Rhodopseudomonas palustris]MDF3812528.1 hypothetical protein [Rhodopseudomonas sp. BAL398]WOK17358.1 hypothetical protein RBJ75_25100 [Rhodopseudomonas sp. BAL398]